MATKFACAERSSCFFTESSTQPCLVGGVADLVPKSTRVTIAFFNRHQPRSWPGSQASPHTSHPGQRGGLPAWLWLSIPMPTAGSPWTFLPEPSFSFHNHPHGSEWAPLKNINHGDSSAKIPQRLFFTMFRTKSRLLILDHEAPRTQLWSPA